MSAQKRVLVTGGAGFIGSHLVEMLVQTGADVCVLDDFSTGHRENLLPVASCIDLVKGDVRDVALLHRVTTGADLVFHLAAVPSVVASIQDPLVCNDVNITGTLNVLTVSRERGVRRVVFTSSAAVYGANPDLPKDENMLTASFSPYATSKIAGEFYCQNFASLFGLETVCLRLFNVFGPRQDPSSDYSGVVSQFIKRLLAGEPAIIHGDGAQSRDFVYVRDVVSALARAAAAPGIAGEIFNVGSGHPTTILELATTLGEIVSPGDCLPPIYAEERSGDIRHSWCDISKAREQLGYAPRVELKEGLTETVDWMLRSSRL